MITKLYLSYLLYRHLYFGAYLMNIICDNEVKQLNNDAILYYLFFYNIAIINAVYVRLYLILPQNKAELLHNFIGKYLILKY